jgi:hypothetical protein
MKNRYFFIILGILFYIAIFLIFQFIYAHFSLHYGFMKFFLLGLASIVFIISIIFIYFVINLFKNTDKLEGKHSKIGLILWFISIFFYMFTIIIVVKLMPKPENLLSKYKPYDYMVVSGESLKIEAIAKHDSFRGLLAINECSVPFTITNKIEFIDDNINIIKDNYPDFVVNIHYKSKDWADKLYYKFTSDIKDLKSNGTIRGDLFVPYINIDNPVKVKGYIHSIPVIYPEILGGSNFSNKSKLIDTFEIDILIIPNKLKTIFQSAEYARKGGSDFDFIMFVGGLVFLTINTFIHLDKVKW